jgi:hypothetical protein
MAKQILSVAFIGKGESPFLTNYAPTGNPKQEGRKKLREMRSADFGMRNALKKQIRKARTQDGTTEIEFDGRRPPVEGTAARLGETRLQRWDKKKRRDFSLRFSVIKLLATV